MGIGGIDRPESRPPGTSVLTVPSERERLIAAMAAACANVGYARVEIDDVVARACLERGAFEAHFRDKQDCALATVDQVLAETTRAVLAADRPGLRTWERVLAATLALLELFAAHPSYARLACIEARHSMPPEAYERYAAGLRILSSLIDRIREFASSMAPATATRGALGGAELLIRRELIAGRADRLPGLLPDITYGTVVPFLDQQEALRYAELARELIKDGR
ncbi:MAG TPA: TetR/AcrR family transcriptional regulator [Solirubrobacterales bacterium]|nr:TetR/AcrR family transcriptional regulator [Solirubrobacterales bacterium]